MFYHASAPAHLQVSVVVVAALSNQKDSTSIEHRVTIRDPWAAKETEIFVHFIPALFSTFQLQTAMAKKFLQILIYPLAEGAFTLRNHQIQLADSCPSSLSLTSLNEEGELVAGSRCEAGYLWQLEVEGSREGETTQPVKGQFKLEYSAGSSSGQVYQANFQFQDFLTLYTIQVWGN